MTRLSIPKICQPETINNQILNVKHHSLLVVTSQNNDGNKSQVIGISLKHLVYDYQEEYISHYQLLIYQYIVVEI